MAGGACIRKGIYINEIMPEGFCRCWNGDDETEPGNPDCGCGEELGIVEWRWAAPKRAPKWVELYEDQKQVVFHPLYSSGTAIVKGNKALETNRHYYWEVKMLTQPYGTDIMVGLGSQEVGESFRDYTSYLGGNEHSFGLSYTGAICKNARVVEDCPGFCKGTIIGVMVDMFLGTLEFYLNREPQGLVFTGLGRHKTWYPMVCSTAAQSSLRLTYASSWTTSLLINAAKVLAASVTGRLLFNNLPPGLAATMKKEFWIPLRSGGMLDKELAKVERHIRDRIKDRRW
ncbi:SPRY domain-containing SOCS box protein 3-like [Helicoverpa zea]|uniref:SPRY domain-containing SOCS box protein 3-like n=1 Tax=Helicoverpa zea TaxID=7113 RepID=UPI001F571B5D|nr:SPRY domain-containing SOCS box protein 3-like [Helicoverpa zea]